MKKIANIILLSSIASCSLIAGDLYINTAAQYETTSFDENSGIDKAETMGLFVSKDLKSDLKVEGGLARTTYQPIGNGEDAESIDATLLSKFKTTKDIIAKAGIHYAHTDIDKYDKAYTLIGGVKMKHTNSIYTDSNVYFTSPKDRDILQLSPKIGYLITDTNYKFGAFTAEAGVDYINNGNNYTSGNIGIKHKISRFTSEAGMWIGERRWAVTNDGYETDKTGIKYTGGFDVSTHYAFTKYNGLKVGYENKDYEMGDGSSGDANTMSVAYNHKF